MALKAAEIWERTKPLDTKADVIRALSGDRNEMTLNSVKTLAGGHSTTVAKHVRSMVNDGVIVKTEHDVGYPTFRLANKKDKRK